MHPAITLTKVAKKFTEEGRAPTPVLHNINLEINEGEFFVFVGPSGSGKSTLLRLMSGLEKSYDGEIALGSGLTRNDQSFVFQQFALFPWLDVAKNIGIGLAARGVPDEECKKKVSAELKRLRLDDARRRYPRELSGGMRQRVGIARAFATDPKIIFMDEPFSELDSFTAAELRTELLAIWQERKPTIIMVTHIIQEAIELADRIAVLTERPATIEKIFTNRLPRPREKRSAEFFKLEDEIYATVKPA